MENLIKKYNVAIPRYTSYPPVPNWNVNNWTPKKWQHTVEESYYQSISEGISLYIHLPFCEDLCTYCACNTRITKNHAVEVPYIEAVLKEWNMYLDILGTKPLLKELHFGGGTPTFFSPKNLGLLLENIHNTVQIADNAAFSFEGHPGNTTREHLEVLFKYGFKRISLGIQDFDIKVQEIINRKQSVEQVVSVVNQAREIGYASVNFDLVYGLPLQKLEGLIDTIEKVIEMRPDRIAFYSYAHVPWVKPGQRKFTSFHLPSADEKLELYKVGREMLMNAGYLEVGMDHFSLPSDSLIEAQNNNTLHRNFMGYTDCHTLLNIALGVSSISDSWYGFAQNVKEVEKYIQIVNEGSLPLLKGHILSQEDLKIRQIILDVMCKEKILVPDSLNELTIKKLEELIIDGLIYKENNYLVITKTGKSFLRNIASVFDEYLEEVSGIEKFSLTV